MTALPRNGVVSRRNRIFGTHTGDDEVLLAEVQRSSCEERDRGRRDPAPRIRPRFEARWRRNLGERDERESPVPPRPLPERCQNSNSALNRVLTPSRLVAAGPGTPLVVDSGADVDGGCCGAAFWPPLQPAGLFPDPR